jgi:hypothetical protein
MRSQNLVLPPQAIPGKRKKKLLDWITRFVRFSTEWVSEIGGQQNLASKPNLTDYT